MITVNRLPRRLVDAVNSRVLALRDHPRLGPWARRRFTTVTYTGRRSGRTFSLPVGYHRDGDAVTITVMLPDAKKWWRNFLGEGGPITLDLDGGRDGHAVARRTARGQVEVAVRLEG
ncbi:hypothetical protein [Pseudonocardia endophytica]|uniref:Deazaflavin-dependent oxidoreductase (Nitroreductase family) n=1 Tax=Pseudonocardia endophytica TaxID=401976 RepID=A0A4R1I1C0_PSEEN|nr:hypothetical protein [Pseudonocardia endophytica]TCK26219.1 hypothetical protein EV378_2048 [Pseudonocardia endophytica]